MLNNMESFMEKIFFAVVVLGLIFGIRKMFFKDKKQTSTENIHFFGGGGSLPEIPRTNEDGSVNPPKEGENAI